MNEYKSPAPTMITQLMHKKLTDRGYTAEQIEKMTPVGALALLEKKENVLLDAALGYARRGWYVFPLAARTKTPMKDFAWRELSTTDADQVRAWWDKRPTANVGIDCGKSGQTVVDVDVKPGIDGRETWSGLCQQHQIDDSHALVSLTGGGGQQLFYNAPNGTDIRNSAGKLGLGVDVRGNGGYVVAPPSIHPNGREYVWETSSHPDDNPPYPLPDALLTLLTKEEKERKNGSEPLPDEIPEGQRNTFLASLAGGMRRRGVSREAILAALEVVNKKRCKPPLPQAELEKIAASMERYEPEDPFVPSPQASIKTKKVTIKDIKTAFNRAETGDAELLAKMFGDSIVYDHGQKCWYRWDVHRWIKDRTGLVRRLVSGPMAAQYYRVASIILEKLTSKMDGDQEKAIRDMAKDYAKRANTLRYKHRIENVLSLATSVSELALTGDEWDKNPWLLGVGNGVVDLRTGKLRDGVPEDYIRTYTPTEWQPEANAPRWDVFLQEVFDGDAELVGFMQRLLGYGITGTQREHKLPILWGVGRNGKDTMLAAIKNTLGAHARAVSAKVMLASRRDASPGSATPYLCDLQGLRLCWAGETREGAWLNVAQIKSMTGGGEQAGRPLYGNPITFMPSYLLMLMTNSKPHADADDFATWQRLLLIPFTQVFVEDPTNEQHLADAGLRQKLEKEASGILRWLVRGCLLWQAQGLNPPDVVLAATEEYRAEEDLFGTFLEECCYLAVDVQEKSSVLYKEYKEWASEYGLRPMSLTAFGTRMVKRFERKRQKDGKWYHGVALAL